MRKFSYSVVLDDYQVIQDGVRTLNDEHFRFLTPEERDTVRGEILEEVRIDCAFKLMTLLERDIRSDYRVTLVRRRRDALSRAYRNLCIQYRRETRQVKVAAKVACNRIALDRILDQLIEYFLGVDEEFRRVCSVIKGYFSFRNWYAHGRTSTQPVIPDPEDILAAYRQLEEKVLRR